MVSGFFENNVVELPTVEEQEKQEVVMTEYERARTLFGKCHKLCFVAQQSHCLADKAFFIRGGIPEDFMNKCIKLNLCGGKPGRNLFWNWSKNLTKPKHTVDNYLDWLKNQA